MTTTGDHEGVDGALASVNLANVALIIPSLNESENLAELLPLLSAWNLEQILVCDNGSTDNTKAIVAQHGATWVFEGEPGYGSACQAGLKRLSASITIVVFIDADLSDDVSMLPALVDRIARDEYDFCLGARRRDLRAAHSTTFPQRFANWLMPMLIRLGWGYRFTDLGPFRAIRRRALDAIGMKDRAFGWTIEMQIRAVELGLRIVEVPVVHGVRRHGKSKISGTVRGVVLAAYWIIRTCGLLWLTKRRRKQ